MRSIVENRLFIAVAAALALGSGCGMSVGLFSKDIGHALVAVRAFVSAYSVLALVTFLLTAAREPMEKRPNRSTRDMQPVWGPATARFTAASDAEPLPGSGSDTQDGPKPAYIDYRQSAGYVCLRCGRTVDHEILTCPDLRSGNCAFREADAPPTASRYGCWSAVAVLGGSALALMTWVIAQEASISLGTPGFWGALLVVAFAVLLIGFGLLGLFRTYAVIQDATSGLAYTHVSSLKLTCLRVLIAREEPLRAPLPSLTPSPLPSSIVALSEPASKAAALFRATLLGLWAKGYVQIRPYRRYIAHGRSRYGLPQDVYAFCLPAASDWASADGELERKVLLALSSWPRARSAGYGLWPHVYEIWPYGPSIYDLVREACEVDAGGSPERWAVSLVADDALARGLGRFHRWPSMRFEPSPEQGARLHLEQASLKALSSWVTREQPCFSVMLDKEIKRAVHSCRSTPEGYYS